MKIPFRLFCGYAALGITLNYLYQVTFFAGVMVLSGRIEKRKSFNRFWINPDGKLYSCFDTVLGG